ncbi:SCO7613 C-terminal domain-containing membrane protein [Demequina sp. NBRC 110054]|uniref:SCO7613 C-terminal domain-containing membrane protein n=1 Tax=Demequina sp. NBRC 110054 TaxID=1570343 RepID=UPI000A0284EC|nr:hypothetical protein [Demequina sp. NBRC 110054]
MTEPTPEVRCPICGAVCAPAITPRCRRCYADLTDSAFAEIVEADARIAGFRAEYDALARRWQDALGRREAAYAALNRTRADSAPAPVAAREESEPVPTAGSRPGPTVVGAPPSAGAPTPEPRRRSALRESLTAPMLLGLGGAALLVASAVVFVAVTWETFFPPAQALLLVALSAATGWLGVWLTRRGLGVSAGAVGVVSMAFAGTSVVALARALTVLGPFTMSAAALAAAAAGTVLARRSLAWVGVASTAALGFAGVGAAVAGGADAGTAGWTLWGTGSIVAISALSRRWLGAVLSTALRYTAAGMVVLVSLGAIAWGWGADDVLWAWLPVASGVGLAAIAPPVALTATVAVASAAAAATASVLPEPGLAMLPVAAVVAVALAVGRRWSQQRHRVVRGLWPAGLGALLAALAALAGVPALVADPDAGEGSAWLLVGLAATALTSLVVRLWTHRDDASVALADRVLLTGAALFVMVLPSAVTLLWPRPEPAALAVTALVVAHLAAASSLAWPSGPARLTILSVAVVIGGISAVGGAFAWSDPTSHVAWAAVAGFAPVVLAALLARRFPRSLGGLAVLLPTLVAGGSVLRLAEGSLWAAAAMVAAAAAASWILARVPVAIRLWASPGLLPAAVVVVMAGLATIAQASDTFLGDELMPRLGGHGAFAATLLAAAVAAGAVRVRVQPGESGLPEGSATWVEAIGVLALLGASVQATLTVSVGGGGALGSSLVGIAAAVAVASSSRWWESRGATLTAFAGATAWTAWLALVALFEVAVRAMPLWPGTAVAAVAIAVLALGARWRATITMPAIVAIATLVPPAIVAARVDGALAFSLTAAASVAAACWLLAPLSPRVRGWASLGLLVAVLPALPAFAIAAWRWFVRLGEAWEVGEAASSSFAPLLLVLAVAAAALSTRRGRASIVSLAVAVAIASLAAPPVGWAWVVGAVAALVAASLGGSALGRGLVTRPAHQLALASSAVVWAGPHAWMQAGALAVTAIVLGLLAARGEAPRFVYGHAAVVSLAAAGWAACVGADASTLAPALALGLYGAGLSALLRLELIARRDAASGLAAASLLAGVFVRVQHDMVGVALAALVTSAAWLVLRRDLGRWARWAAAAYASVGVALLIHVAGVAILEAYTVLPAVWALAEGVAWMRRDAEVPSVTAIGGGLALVLAPSIVALALQPGALIRTLVLTLAIAGLAFATVMLRWLAPAVAAASTAIAVALAQLFVDEQLLPRWVSFAVVGAVLIALAATYERLKELR